MMDAEDTDAPDDTAREASSRSNRPITSPWVEPQAENSHASVIARGYVPGVWTSGDGEVEQVGLLLGADGHYTGGMTHKGRWGHPTRLGKRVRADLSETQQAREQAAWEACVAANAAFWASPHTAAYPAAGRRLLAALRQYWTDYGHVTHPDQVAPRRISKRVRREVRAEWETTRVCGICWQVVAPDEPVHLHHRRAVADGGTRDRENLTYAHAYCNLRGW
jgi:HNH endonuclease